MRNGVPLKTKAGCECIENTMLFLLDVLGGAFQDEADDGC